MVPHIQEVQVRVLALPLVLGFSIATLWHPVLGGRPASQAIAEVVEGVVSLSALRQSKRTMVASLGVGRVGADTVPVEGQVDTTTEHTPQVAMVRREWCTSSTFGSNG